MSEGAAIIDGNLISVARHGLQCAQSWAADARIIGNARACDLADIFARFLALEALAYVIASDEKQPSFRREHARLLVSEVPKETGSSK